MPDIDLEGITPTAADPTDLQVVRRGSDPFDIALVAPSGGGEDFDALQSEVIAARGGRDALGDRLSVIANFASPVVAGPVSGRYYDQSAHALNQASFAIVNDRLWLVPVYFSQPTTIDQIGVNVVTGNAGSQGRCCIYSSGEGNWPFEPLLETASFDTTTNGSYAFAAVDFTYQPGTQYWNGYLSSGTPTLRAVPSGASFSLGLSGSTTAASITNIRFNHTFGDPLPDPYVLNTSDLLTGNNISIRYRVA